jgi:hypothetical protein
MDRDFAADTIPEFCQRYKISRSRTYRELAAGRLRAVKSGSRTIIPPGEGQRWFEALPAYRPTATEEAE